MILSTTSHLITVDIGGYSVDISWSDLSSALSAAAETASSIVVRCSLGGANHAVRLPVGDAERYLVTMESVRATVRTIEAGVSA